VLRFGKLIARYDIRGPQRLGAAEGGVMVQAIRDQWAVIVAVIALVGLVVWLWRTRSKVSR